MDYDFDGVWPPGPVKAAVGAILDGKLSFAEAIEALLGRSGLADTVSSNYLVEAVLMQEMSQTSHRRAVDAVERAVEAGAGTDVVMRVIPWSLINSGASARR